MTTASSTTADHKNLSPEENLKNIENHRKVSTHLDDASKHHIDAAKHHEAGNHEKAAQSTIVANGHLLLANEAQKEDVKHHASVK